MKLYDGFFQILVKGQGHQILFDLAKSIYHWKDLDE